MDDVGAFTGGREALASFRSWLLSGRVDLEPMRILEGPSGCGKTWTVRALVDDLGESFAYAFMSGDQGNTSRELLPFRTLTSPHVLHDIREIVPEVASAVPHAGLAVKTLLRYLLSHGESRQATRSRSIGDSEREALYQLQRLARGRRLLLVLDDLQSWDAASLSLLHQMLDGNLTDAFPFLARTSFLGIVNSEATIATPKGFDAVMMRFRARVIWMRLPHRGEYPAVLSALGMNRDLDQSESDALYAISGGHLALASRIANYVERGGEPNSLARETHFYRFCVRLIDERLRDPSVEEDLRRLLAAAAVIGSTFSTEELTCLAGPSSMLAVDRAKALQFFVDGDGRLEFAHELLRKVVLETVSISPVLHAKFAACLAIIDPADYSSRAIHHEMAGQVDEARVLRAHAILNAPDLVNAEPFEEDGVVGRFVRTMIEAQSMRLAGDYQAAIEKLEHVDLSLPNSLRMERDAALARCLVKTLLVENQRKAVDILSVWSDEKSELDVWQRIMQQYAVALGFVGEIEEADTAARRLVSTILKSPKSPRQAWMVNRVALNADVYQGAEAANGVLRDAVAFFGPSADSYAVRDPILYWVGICNLVANEILRGNYEAARDAAQRCAKFAATVDRGATPMRLPRTDIAANNAILADYLCGVSDAATSSENMRTVSRDSASTNDASLVLNNALALRLLSGRRDGVADKLESVFASFGASIEIDPYYIYFVGSNLATAHAADGNGERARAVWKSLDRFVDRAAPKLTPYLRPRHVLLSRAFDALQPTFNSLVEAMSPYERMSPGPAFRLFATPVLLSDLQFFTDL